MDEVGRALGVLALLILALLTPLHLTAEARAASGDDSALAVICSTEGRAQSSDPRAGAPTCDVCVLAKTASLFDAPPPPSVALPIRRLAFAVMPAPRAEPVAPLRVVLPEVRGPPIA